MITHRIKYMLAAIINRHPMLWFVAWRMMPYLTFLLPHEKSYYAFRHLATKDAGLFLDVGANNGISALGFRRLIPHYSILSIEANRLHEPELKKRKQKLANFDYMITAAGNESSQFTLFTAMYRGMILHTGSSLNLDYLKKGLERAFSKGVMDKVTYSEQAVKVIRLDDLGLKPDVIKTDAEGFDWEVLLGLQETIAGNRPSVLVEYMPSLPDRLEPFCGELSYDILVYDYRNDRFARFDRERELQAHLKGGSPVNLFMIPREKVSGLPMVPA